MNGKGGSMPMDEVLTKVGKRALKIVGFSHATATAGATEKQTYIRNSSNNRLKRTQTCKVYKYKSSGSVVRTAIIIVYQGRYR